MADAAGCQRSYLSKSLNSEVHLTPDHIFNIGKYLNLSESELDYLLLLLEKDRASSARYQAEIIRKLKRLKSENEDLKNITQRKAVSLGGDETNYYSTWLATALHIIVSIPQYQTVKAISEKLQADASLVELTLNQLSTMGLVRKEKSNWIYHSGDIHLSKSSPFVHIHHSNWRQRAILDSQKQNSDSLHFTVVQSIDKAAYEQIYQRILALLREFNSIAGPAKPEQLINFNCDFFKV